MIYRMLYLKFSHELPTSICWIFLESFSEYIQTCGSIDELDLYLKSNYNDSVTKIILEIVKDEGYDLFLLTGEWFMIAYDYFVKRRKLKTFIENNAFPTNNQLWYNLACKKNREKS